MRIGYLHGNNVAQKLIVVMARYSCDKKRAFKILNQRKKEVQRERQKRKEQLTPLAEWQKAKWNE